MHIHPEDIELYARDRVSEAQRTELEAHLKTCRYCMAKAEAAVEFSQALGQLQREVSEMRADHRIPTDDPATLQVLSPMSSEHWDVRIRDVSKGGMCVRTSKPIDRGAQVKVQRGAVIACGEVRYCVPVGDAFHIGIRLLEVLSGPGLTDK